jgi:transcription termination factor NusB
MDSLTPEKTIELLKQALHERDQTLLTLKSRTKAFVDGIKLEKQALEEQIEKQVPQIKALQKQVGPQMIGQGNNEIIWC